MKKIKFTISMSNILLVCILLIAIFLRFFMLDAIPASLNHDETALGYNAYALAKTGADEHGKFLPLSLESFGDWKLPGYPILDIIPISIFGLNEFAVRFPSALAGVIEVLLVYGLALALFKKKPIALLAALLLAVSPWGIYFSRIAYETNVATCFFLGGLLLFIQFLNKKVSSGAIPVVAILFGITLFIYHSFIIFIPFFCIGLLLIFHKQLKKDKKNILALSILLLFFTVSIYTQTQTSKDKLSTIGIFNDANLIYNRVDKFRSDNSPKNFLHTKILHNKYLTFFYQIGENYIASFSPSFLFDKGGEKLLHTTGVFGNLYLFDALLLVVGTALLFWYREKSLSLLVVWLLTSPIASSITKDAPSSTRLFVIFPLLMLVASYGMYHIFHFLFKKIRSAIFGYLLLGMFILNVLFFLDVYFFHLNNQRALFLHYGYKQIVKVTNKYPNAHVVMRGPDNFPYISFLFYDKYDPRRFQREVSYYPPTNEGYIFVKNFGRYKFVDTIDYENLEPDTLYIDDRGIRKEDMTINLPSGEPIFKYFFKK